MERSNGRPEDGLYGGNSDKEEEIERSREKRVLPKMELTNL